MDPESLFFPTNWVKNPRAKPAVVSGYLLVVPTFDVPALIYVEAGTDRLSSSVRQVELARRRVIRGGIIRVVPWLLDRQDTEPPKFFLFQYREHNPFPFLTDILLEDPYPFS